MIAGSCRRASCRSAVTPSSRPSSIIIRCVTPLHVPAIKQMKVKELSVTHPVRKKNLLCKRACGVWGTLKNTSIRFKFTMSVDVFLLINLLALFHRNTALPARLPSSGRAPRTSCVIPEPRLPKLHSCFPTDHSDLRCFSWCPSSQRPALLSPT